MPRIRKEARAITHKFPFKETNQDSRYWTKNLRKQRTKIHTFSGLQMKRDLSFLGRKHRKKNKLFPLWSKQQNTYTSLCSRCFFSPSALFMFGRVPPLASRKRIAYRYSKLHKNQVTRIPERFPLVSHKNQALFNRSLMDRNLPFSRNMETLFW